MKKYPLTIRDGIGNQHERRHLYLKALSKAQADGFNPDSTLSADDAYFQELAAFRQKEKTFLKELRQKEQSKADDQSVHQDQTLRRLEAELAAADSAEAFYQPYCKLSYDAQLEHDVAVLKKRHLPGMIDALISLDKQIDAEKLELRAAEKLDLPAIDAEIAQRSEACKQALKQEKLTLRQKYREGLISEKALKTESKRAELATQEELRVLRLQNPVKRASEQLSSLHHQRKVLPKISRDVLLSDIADRRRKTPVETTERYPWHAFAGLLLPGLGQALNRQWIKAILFFLSSLFIYAVAIPYSLGYGNYRGEGLHGLISLAAHAAKVDRSIIFMIEGIISIVLLVFALAFILLAFRDAYRVQKAKIQGVRPHNWFETRQAISQNGFPYLVSAPALLVIVFMVLVPIATTILLSLTNMDPSHQAKFSWIGLANYNTLIFGQGVAGKTFWSIFGWTLIWTVAATTLAIAIGFFLALICNQERIRFKRFWRTVFLLPWAVPAFITIMFFSVMFAPNGPLTAVLSGLVGHAVNIKNSTVLIRCVLIALQGWLGSAYVFLLTTGILQGIPSDLYEAAEIDGATGFQQTRHITIPLVLYQIAPLIVTQYTFNFNNYSIIALFNNGGPFDPRVYGNLAGSSDILISYIFKLTIENQYQGLGAAITLLISLMLMFVAWLGFRRTKAFAKDA